MAQQTVVTLTCDVDANGTEASDTIELGLEGAHYEIDLCEEHADELREALERFLTAGRPLHSQGRLGRINASRTVTPRVTPRAVATQTTRTKTRPDALQLKAIREWARQQGYQISDRGRIAVEITNAYHAQQ
jgi:hypothetical protein